MRQFGLIFLMSVIVLGGPCQAWSASDDRPETAPTMKPPSRPHALTAAQFDALSALERQRDHAAVLLTQASYTSEREARMDMTRTANNILTGSWYVGFPGAILAVLVAAAPL